jgi:hypothetical protein
MNAVLLTNDDLSVRTCSRKTDQQQSEPEITEIHFVSLLVRDFPGDKR